MGLSIAIATLTGLSETVLQSAPEIRIGISLFIQLFSLWITFNLYKMMINLVDGKAVRATDIINFSNDTLPKLGRYFLANLLLSLIVLVGIAAFIIFYLFITFTPVLMNSVFSSIVAMVGLIIFIFPTIYLLVRFMFVPYLLIDKDIKIMDAFKKSSEMTRGEIWHLIGFSLLSFGIILVGLIALIVGVIPAVMLVTLTTVVIYRKLESHVHDSVKQTQQIEEVA